MTSCGLAVGGRSQHREPDPFAVAIIALDNHSAKIDTDTEPNASFLGHLGLAVNHPALDLDGTTNRVDNPGKLGKEAVASILYDPAAVLFDVRLNKLPEMGFEPLVGSSHRVSAPSHARGGTFWHTGRSHFDKFSPAISAN